jgi:hypothetical protein
LLDVKKIEMLFLHLKICHVIFKAKQPQKMSIVYHRPSFKTKPEMKKEYAELVEFIEGQLIDEGEKNKELDKKNQEILELKQQNLKLIQAVDILNKQLAEKDKKEESDDEEEETVVPKYESKTLSEWVSDPDGAVGKLVLLAAQATEFEMENKILLSVVSGDYSVEDEFRTIARKHFTQHYIKSCLGDGGILSQYFEDEVEAEEAELDPEEIDDEESDIAYKCCRDCDYTWDTKEEWEAGKGRVAFCYPAEEIQDGDIVCSLCYKGEEEYFPSNDEEDRLIFRP